MRQPSVPHSFCRRAFCGALAALLLAGCGLPGQSGTPADTRQKFSVTYWDVFDTVTQITGYAENEAAFQTQAKAIHEDLQRLHRYYDIYNHYDGITNLCDLNSWAADAPLQVDEPVFTLLLLAKEACALTGGKTNAAAGRLFALWHDAREEAADHPEAARLPEAAALTAAAQHCDMDDLILDSEQHTVFYADPALRLDVGSIGKGYAVELAAQAAQARGADSLLLSVGGNLRVIGQKPTGPWVGGVENPWAALGQDSEYGSLVGALSLQPGQCLVTSGSYQRYYTVDGVNYCHLIDPNTGYPAARLAAVTVLADDSGMADALSTGLFCMTVEEGQRLVESLAGVEACWMTTDGKVLCSDGFVLSSVS